MKASILILFFFFSFPLIPAAQLCSGSLGDPIVNLTFGTRDAAQLPANTGFEPARSCPSKGQYVLANLIFGCGDNRSWLMLAGDHTRDVNGNYMLVNAENTSEIVYADTVRGLCSNTNYVFSAWIANAMRNISCEGKPVLPKLNFVATSVNGDTIAFVSTENIVVTEERQWQQYGISFQLPANSDAVVLSIATDQKMGCGSGFVIDDITLRTCGPLVMASLGNGKDTVEICSNYTDPFVLSGSYASGLSNPVVQWQYSADTGKAWQNLAEADRLFYTLPHIDDGLLLYRLVVGEAENIGNAACRFVSNVIFIRIHPLPPKQKPQNLIGCIGQQLAFPQKDPWAATLSWSGPNGYTSNLENASIPVVTEKDTGLYQRMQDYNFGCINTDSFYVKVFPGTVISTPASYAVCEGGSVKLAASGEGTFSWQPAAGLSNPNIADPVASPKDSTDYKVMITNQYGCKDSAVVSVLVHRNPKVDAGPDRSIVLGDTISLKASVAGTGVRFSWTPVSYMRNSNTLDPAVFPTGDTRYTLSVQSALGCGTRSDDVMIKVFNDIYIPNAFTPNNDGINDVFRVVAADGYTLEAFQVFNRWGQVVYSAQGFDKGWDGTYRKLLQPYGMYPYLIRIRSASGKLITKKGTVSLL